MAVFSPANALYFALGMLAAVCTVIFFCCFRRHQASRRVEEDLAAAKFALKPVGKPPTHSSHVASQKSRRCTQIIEEGDTSSMLDVLEDPTQDLKQAKDAAEKDLPRDEDGTLWRLSAPRWKFARLGLGVFAYMTYLEAITYIFLALLLISTSNIVSNLTGGYYNRDDIGLQSWLFAVTSIGNTMALSPAYGASEFVCATLMVTFLYKGKAALEEEVESAEAGEVTPADFAVMLDGVPNVRCVREHDKKKFDQRITEVLNEFVGADEASASGERDRQPLKVRRVVPALDQREIILLAQEHSAHAASLNAIKNELQEHPTANKPEQLRRISTKLNVDAGTKEFRERSRAVLKRLDTTQRGLLAEEAAEADADRLCELQLAAQVVKREWDRCAGVVFVSFETQHDADRVLKRASETIAAAQRGDVRGE